MRFDTDEDTTSRALTRQGFLQALLVAVGALLAVGLAWLISRGAPSAGRDAEFIPPALAPTRAAATPAPDEDGG